MRNAGLEEAQAGIKIAGKNLNNLRYADDITLMGESVLPVLLLRHLGSSPLMLGFHGIQSHPFMGNRWGNSGNRVRHD